MPARRRFYQVLNVVLDITLREDLELQSKISNLTRMCGEEILGDAAASVSGKIRFLGLTPMNVKIDGIDKHSRIIESCEKLPVAR